MTDELTRRAALTLGAGALASLAGCSALDETNEERTYDASAFESFGPESAPRANPPFPLAVPESRVRTHRERTRAALERVPENPSLPNEAMAEEIASERRHVAERVGEDDGDESPLERLAGWRHHRNDAVSLAATWAAATGEFDPAALRSRRESVRSDRYAALDRWDYRGPSAPVALVVHEWVEGQFADVERELAPWPPVPDDPTESPFVVGDAARGVDDAAATLGDVEAILGPVEERGPSHRTAVVAVAHTLDHPRMRGPDRIDVDDYVDERGRPALGRDVEDTPGRYAFERARRTLEAARESSTEDRRRGEFASAAMWGATSVVAADAFRAVVDGIRADEFDPPPDADAVREQWSAAVDALERAWRHEPTALSVGLADSARGHLRNAGWALGESDVDAREIDRAMGAMGYAERYAERVPDAVDAVVEVLDDA